MLGPLMIDVVALSLTDEEKLLLKHPLVGGVIFFKRNYQSRAQLNVLVEQIRQVNPALLIAVDQEGGRVQRFVDDFTRLPPMGVLGQIYENDANRAGYLAKQCAWLMAAELLACDIDFSFAPVVDLDRSMNNVVGNRSFNKAPTVVIELARQFIDGMREAGMAAVIKHFPGHGCVNIDSHLSLPVCDLTFEDKAMKESILPFATIIKQGINAVMVAHIQFLKLDKSIVSCSKFCLQDILRHQLGFHGAIFTDDMNMAAAASGGDALGRCQQALQAGCDMVLLCNNRPAVLEVIDKLRDCRDEKSQQRLVKMRHHQRYSIEQLRQTARWRQAHNAMMELV
ncbi:MAG: beta-N-acetylhexosaminidase [Pseudomonadota bacterium]